MSLSLLLGFSLAGLVLDRSQKVSLVIASFATAARLDAFLTLTMRQAAPLRFASLE
ncbi:hypothetical protein [Celeribacter sp. SCSIO 80788]|jgi:hypothetical protein|uniref:hypothetical protein n=1 Tax=Celeribacter sp. SCSIO 80788 TaxID=3117013 RepID=UPI003DA5B349